MVTGLGKVGDDCNVVGNGDNCRPGLICIDEVNPQACGKHCYRHCRSDKDCGNGAHCTVDLMVEGKTKVCDNPPEACSPLFGQGNCVNGRPFPTFGCYIMSSTYPNEAVCDCAGSLQEDAACVYERDCKPGLICVKAAANEEARCRRVCPVGQADQVRQICGMRACSPYHASARWGYCRSPF
jgi:hypothetical protein